MPEATFSYRLIHWECRCGNVPDTVHVGTTSHGCLIGTWKCAKCGLDVKATIEFERLIADLPEAPKVEEKRPIHEPLGTQLDNRFLKRAHITLSEGGDS